MESRIDAVYADPQWVRGVTAGYMVGEEEMKERKGHCPMMVTVEVRVEGPEDEEGKERERGDEGVNLPPLVA